MTKARYTPNPGESKIVDIDGLVADVYAMMSERQRAAALGRLVDLLVARNIMTGGDVLHVLGVTGTLSLTDPLALPAPPTE